MPRRKIPLIDVIKINSKKILDIISKYEGSIDEIKARRNKYYSKKTPNRSLYKRFDNDYKYLMRFEKKGKSCICDYHQ